MITVELMGVRTKPGMIEASTMRTPPSPYT